MDLLNESKKLANLIEQEASAADVPVTVSVVDIHGNLILKHRMNGAHFISVEMSERKAYTSALLRMTTADTTPLVQPGGPLFTVTSVAGGRFCALGGGVPIENDGLVVAGVGVSGGTTEQDVEIVNAAIRRYRELDARNG